MAECYDNVIIKLRVRLDFSVRQFDASEFNIRFMVKTKYDRDYIYQFIQYISNNELVLTFQTLKQLYECLFFVSLETYQVISYIFYEFHF